MLNLPDAQKNQTQGSGCTHKSQRRKSLNNSHGKILTNPAGTVSGKDGSSGAVVGAVVGH
jgi:hypothetical protein